MEGGGEPSDSVLPPEDGQSPPCPASIPRSCSRQGGKAVSPKAPYSTGATGAAPSGPTEAAFIQHRRLRPKETVRMGTLPFSERPVSTENVSCEKLTRARSMTWKACRGGPEPPFRLFKGLQSATRKPGETGLSCCQAACNLISNRPFKSIILKNIPGLSKNLLIQVKTSR